MIRYLCFLQVFCVLTACAFGQTGEQLVASSNVRGGIAVVLGGKGQLAAELGDVGSFAVHLLAEDTAVVAKTRATLRKKGAYGRVSADRYDGVHLPYVDNLVNLLVASEDCKVPAGEIARVLAPRGVVLVPKGHKLDSACLVEIPRGYRKAVPEGIDDWTHFLHGPDNNAVARDSVVGPPRHMQWVCGPRYGRHHDKMSSFTAAVSSEGRVFYISDEASPISVLTAPAWKLIARDAFNGTFLWKRDIAKWHDDLSPYKSGPAHLPRKLVADDGKVFVTLTINGPATSLDAATGETLRTYKGTDGADELMYADGTLYVQKPDGLTAIDAESGDARWTLEAEPVRGSLAVDGSRVAYLEGDRIVCLDRQNGKEQWRSEPVPRPEKYHLRFNPILILHGDIVLFAGGEKSIGHKDGQGNYSWFKDIDDTITALSAETGKKLWDAPHPLSGYASSEDLFVIDGVVWCGETTSGHAVGRFCGRDVKTGKVVKEFDPDVKTYWFHHRCYRGKATEKYILTSRTGIEFIDPKTEHWQFNHWVRGACLYGIMPANGLLYSPQNPCACFPESKLDGFSALAHARAPVPEAAKSERFEKGPSYAVAMEGTYGMSGEWPTYRGDAARSGSTDTSVPEKLKVGWTTALGGRLSAPTIAGDRVFVAAIDRHQVVALDEATGKELWRYTAGGRVDSPPTICGGTRQAPGLCLFGSRDGTITCLNAADGGLVWRFRAAPADRRVMAFDQLESCWPVSGSVLIQKNVIYAVAGRSLFLDGGLRLLRLDPLTGKLLSETVMDETDEEGNAVQSYARQHNMPVGLPDVLSCDGKHVFMRSQAFELDGTRLPLKALKYGGNPQRYSIPSTQDPEFAHLFSPTGFLDDSWWHRTYWVYGSRFIGGWAGYPQAGTVAPGGRILVFDDERVYGFGRLPQYYRWTKPIEHHLFAARKTGFRVRDKNAHAWKEQIAMFPRGMVKAGDLLFLAGPTDIVDEPTAMRGRYSATWQDKIKQQDEAFGGKHGGLLRAVRAETGEKASEIRLDSIPVFDGMATAHGKLYLSLVNGTVVRCE